MAVQATFQSMGLRSEKAVSAHLLLENALLSQAAARSRSSSDSQTCFSGPLSYAFCCSWNSSNRKRGVQPFLRTISMPACCFATADSTTTACVQLPYLGNVSLLPFLRNNCRAKTSTFPSLHSPCFAVAKQRQALSHLYTALASLLQNKDKHFPISIQHFPGFPI